MLVGRRAPIPRTPAELGLAYEDLASRPPMGSASEAGSSRATREGPGPAVVFVHGWLWNRAGNVAGRCRSKTTTSTSCPRPRRSTRRAITCCCSTSRQHGRARRKGSQSLMGRRRRRTSSAPSTTCARARRWTPNASARSALDGRQLGALCRAGGPADPGLLAIQSDAPPVFNKNFAARIGRLGPALAAGRSTCSTALRPPRRTTTIRGCRRAGSTTRSSGTSRAPGTSGARWGWSRSSRR